MQTPLPFSPADPAPTIQLHHGDCLEVMPTLVPNSIKMCFADLPYATPFKKVTANDWDVPFDLSLFWGMMKVVCRPNAAQAMTSIQPFTSALMLSNPKMFRYDLVWEKQTPTQFFNANKMPLRKHETVMIFYKSLPTFNPQKTLGKPYRTNANRLPERQADKNYDSWPGGPRINETGERYPVSVIRFLSQEKRTRLHPTQKPVALLEWLIKTYTNPGDTVLDPCFGSATTGVACLRTGRNFVGIEKDAGYFEIGRKRMAEEQVKLGYEVTV